MTKKFLPRLSEERSPNPQSRPSWHIHDGGWDVLREYADALETSEVGRLASEQIKSIPSPWARLLLFEHALRSETHPATEAVRSEWRGLLGCIALAERFHLDLEVVPANLDQATGPTEALLDMVPDRTGGPRWNRFGIIRVGDEIIGGTSPLTLLFTGFRPVQLSVPFLKEGRLVDPGAHFSDPAHPDPRLVGDLKRWIVKLRAKMAEKREALVDYLGGGDRGGERANTVLRELDKWESDLRGGEEGSSEQAQDPTSSPFDQTFPAAHPGRILIALQPLPPIMRGGSDLQLRGKERTVDPGATGLLVRNGVPISDNIDLPGLASVPVTDGKLQEGISAAQLGPDPTDFSRFFQPRLIQVLDASSEAKVLSVGSDSYLYPLEAEILNYLSPTDLMDGVTAESSGDGVRVSLEVSVRQGLHVKYIETFDLADQLRGYDSPDLAQWPNFKADDWPYNFFYSRIVEPEGTLKFSPTVPVDDKMSSSDGLRTWGRTNDPILSWVGRAEDQEGLMLVPTDAAPAPDSEWDISIDFGSTHTRVFRQDISMAGTVEPQTITLEERARVLLGGAGTLPGNFFPSADVPMQDPQEPRSLVRILPDGLASREWLPSDGIIFFDSLRNTGLEGVRSNLKWHEPGSQDESAFQSYIRHLYIAVAAEAANVGAKVKNIHTAFPSVFPRHLRSNHEEQWKTLERLFQVDVTPPVSESAALAAYVRQERGIPVTANLLAVDVGGSTADFAVRYDEEYHGDSVRLAGQLIVGAAAKSEEGRNAVRLVLDAPPFDHDVPSAFKAAWEQSDFEHRALLFNALLRYTDRKHGGTHRLARTLYQGLGSDGEKLIAYAGFLYAALSFYMGLMVDQCGLDRESYNLYFAGRGAGFLPWLEQLAPGSEEQIPVSFFRAASQKQDASVTVERSSKKEVKTEVGMGLLLKEHGSDEKGSQGSAVGGPTQQITMVGEGGYSSHGDRLLSSDDFTREALEGIERPEAPDHIPDPVVLKRFLSTFKQTQGGQTVARALDLPLDGISPELKNDLYEYLFGEQSPWHLARREDRSDELLVDPLLLTEIKALIRHTSGISFPGV